MKLIMIAPIRLTPAQKEWLAKEKIRTGNPEAAVIRNMIQKEIEKGFCGGQ